MPDSTDKPSVLSSLSPRKSLSSGDIDSMLHEMQCALQDAQSLDFFERMELNHDTRFSWWPGQTSDGRKWPTRERAELSAARLLPGQTPRDLVFPWPGSSDVRERLVEKVIREHVTWKKLALARRQERIGPRDLSPDQDPQAAAALWAQVSSYYEDINKRDLRTALAQWADITAEYGHSLLHIGWETTMQAVPRSLSADDLQASVSAAAVAAARQVNAAEWINAGGDPESVPELDAEQVVIIEDNAERELAALLEDPAKTAILAEQLRTLDSEMPKDESLRLAKRLKWGEPTDYYATTALHSRPVCRALTYGIDVFFPPTATRVSQMPWICMPEWLTEQQLRDRINDPNLPYDESAIKEVLQHPGKSFDLSSLFKGSTVNWLLSGGHVRSALNEDNSDRKLYQVLNVYYLAAAIGNVRALYHTVLHGCVKDRAIAHACCEHAHGVYPFVEHLTDTSAPYLLAAEGYGERSFTDQNEIKVQRDMCSDNASITIKPPMRVPLNQSGGRIDIRPGVQIPMRSNAANGMLEKIPIGSDATGSQAVQAATLDAFNEYWFRGPKVDPEVKLAYRQVLISDFLTDVEAVKVQIFQLIQQFAPMKLRASFYNGLPTKLEATRTEIQGLVGVELDYDVGDMDPAMQEKRWKGLETVLRFDNQNLVNREPILRAICATLLPSHYKQIIASSENRGREEAEDEQNINSRILSGTLIDEAATLIPGTNHALRLQVMQRIYGLQVDGKGNITATQPVGLNGQPSRAQRLFAEDPEVQSLVLNRIKFHSFQLEQQQNAETGRLGVEPVLESAIPPVP